MANLEKIRSRFWNETAEEENPFSAEKCYCAGYDVYEDILPNASWFEYLYLLLTSQRASNKQRILLEKLSIALANPGPRDYSVRGAMNAAVGKSTAAASLIATIAIGAGNSGGAREVYHAMNLWHDAANDLPTWQDQLTLSKTKKRSEIWCDMEHPPGFDPHSNQCSKPVLETLNYLSGISSGPALPWLYKHRLKLEKYADCPLSMSGVAAAAFIDLSLNSEQGEILFLILRLPGAAAHALEQKQYGWRRYPFFSKAMNLKDDPMTNVEDEHG